MVWLWKSSATAKSHFYVWYLGSKEADGVKGQSVVLPVMRQLLRESFRKSPNKATVQISTKGLKLIQSVLTVSKSGKMKVQLVKIGVAANCITFSMTGKPPFDDVVGVVMLVLNPEMRNPMHVHCYRCDCPESAAILQANLQLLIGRPENQKMIVSLQEKLFMTGMMEPRNVNLELHGTLQSTRRLQNELKARLRETRQEGDSASLGPDFCIGSLGGHNVPHYLRNKRYSVTDLPSAVEAPARFRAFGDTMIKSSEKSRSVDNLNKFGLISRNLRAGPPTPPLRFPRSETSETFGRSYEKSLNVESFWKQRQQKFANI
uniref:PID domain-containing protein n=1 Tax=Panagrolaimus sp. JU765 TaxID=591449 RepID=A0AC34RAT7_9BILA